MKILQTTDHHIDGDRMDRVQPALDQIVAIAKEHQVDLHVMTGDFWNRRQSLTSPALLPAIGFIEELAEISPVLMIYGNDQHDGAGSLELFTHLKTTHQVLVASRAQTVIYIEALGLKSLEGLPPDEILNEVRTADAVIHCLPYPTKAHFLEAMEAPSIDEANRRIQELLRQLFQRWAVLSDEATCPVLVLAHCNVAGSTLSTGQQLLGQDIIISRLDLEMAKADVYCLGHIHKAQDPSEHMHYGGSIYHNNWGETESKGVFLHEVESC